MTKDEYLKNYLGKAKVSQQEFDRKFVVLRCKCEAVNCEGWAVVENDPLSIDRHNWNFNPRISLDELVPI